MNTDGTREWPKVSERQRESVNAMFGRADLVGENHFRFSRDSGLPRDYFRHNRHSKVAEVCIALLAASYLIAVVASIL
jgi:hypothetical protein